MAKHSAGLVLYRRTGPAPEVLLAHPGGPFWAKKDEGAWSIPKGLIEGDETPLAAAKREFAEETGFRPRGTFVELGSFKQPSGKFIHAFAVEGDFDPRDLKSSAFTLAWPPKSGRSREFPEVNRAGWFTAEQAARKILKGQLPIVRAVFARLAEEGPRPKPSPRRRPQRQ